MWYDVESKSQSELQPQHTHHRPTCRCGGDRLATVHEHGNTAIRTHNIIIIISLLNAACFNGAIYVQQP